MKLNEGHGFYMFSKRHKVLFDEAMPFKREARVQVIIKVAILSAILFSEFVLSFSYFLIKLHSGFVLVSE